MGYVFLDKKVQKIIEGQFVFLSYCWNDKKVYDRVQKLAAYLKKEGIPLVYDEGGKPAGTEMSEFESLILHDNCACCLVVNDVEYIAKVKSGQGGVAREYHYIKTDYFDNIGKYIPLKVNGIVDLFRGTIYIDFKDESNFEEIKIAVENRLNEKALPSKEEKTIELNIEQKISNYISNAEELIETKEYTAALRKINSALKLYEDEKLKVKAMLVHIYTTKLNAYISKHSGKEAVAIADKLLDILPQNTSSVVKATVLANCALAYGEQKDCYGEKYEDCAREAYYLAKNADADDMDHYASIYSTALFEMDQFITAHKYAKEALSVFAEKHDDIDVLDENERYDFVMLQNNVAEIGIAYSKMDTIRKAKRESLIKEASDIIYKVLPLLDEYDMDDEMRSSIYSTAESVYSSLKHLYGGE